MTPIATRDVSRLEEIIESQKKVIVSQREKLQWYEGILSNKKLQGSTRLATIAAKQLADTSQPGEDGYYKVYLPKLADMVGVSPSAMSRGLRTLADCTDALEHRTEAKKDEPYKDVVFIRPTDLLNHPELIAPTKEIKRHGGSRKCECGGDLLVKERVLTSQQYSVCTACGEQHIFPARIVNEALEVSDPLHDATAINEQDCNIMLQLPAEEISDPHPLHDATGICGTSAVTPPEEIGDPSRCKMQPIPLHSGVSGVQFDSIPDELKAVPHFMPWKFGDTPNEKGKFRKIPRDAKGNWKDYTDSANWMTFEQAVASCNGYQFDGIGYVFSEDDPFTGIDKDGCIDLATGAISEEAQKIDSLIRSYGEISPSGTGIKWIARGKIEHSGKDGDFEMYDHKRFFTITGNRLPAAPTTIEYRQAQLDRLNAPMAAKRAKKPQAHHCVSVPCGLPVQMVLKKCREGQKGAWFERLHSGDISGYPSQSEAELAYCNEVAYRCDDDVSMIDAVYRQSGLARDKWDEMHGDETYGQRTIRLALCGKRRIAS